MIDWAVALNWLASNAVSMIALVVSAGALMISLVAYRRARKMGSLNVRFEAITHSAEAGPSAALTKP
jgi:hypothetical protein